MYYKKLAQSTFQYYLVLQSLHKLLPSTTLYYKACTKSFPVLLGTTKLAQSTSQYYCLLQSLHKALPSTTLYYKKLAQSTFQYYFVLQSLHKLLPSTTLYYKVCTNYFQYYFVLQSLHKAHSSTTVYYKACTKHFPVLLCTTKLAQSTSQYYFVLQSLHKAHPSTTLYYKACTKHVPALHCTTRLAQNTSQYYCVLQSLHKLLPSTTLDYKACTNYFPVLLCTTKLAQSTSQYYFVLQKACTKHIPVLLSTTKFAQTTSQYYFVLQKACTKHFRLHQNHSTTSDLLLLYRKAYAAANIAVPCQQLPAAERIFLWRLVAGTPAVPGPGATLAAVLPGLCNLLSRQPIRQKSLAQKHGRKQLHCFPPLWNYHKAFGSRCAPLLGLSSLTHASSAVFWKSSCSGQNIPALDGSWPAQCHASFHVQNSSVVVRSSSLCMLRSPTNNWPSTCKACKVHNADSSSAKRCGWPSGLAVKCTVPIARMAPLPRSCTCTASKRRGDSGAKGDTDMRNLRMVAVFSSMQTSKGSALTLPRPMAVATSYPWLRAICNKSSTHDGVTSCKHKISHLQSMSWKPSSRFFTCMFSVPKVTRISAQLTSAFKSAAGWARFSSCTSTYTAGTSTPTPLWRSCILHLSVSLLYHLRRARRTSWQLFVMSNCFWAIEIWHGCHWWSKQSTLSSSNSLTSCADNCVRLREPASFHTQHAFTHRTLTHSAFTNGKRLHTHSKLFKQRSFSHREAFTHNKLLHRESFTHSKLSHTASVYTQNTCAQCFYTWHGKTQGFVLRLPPQHKAHATSCSHSNAIWHHSFKKRIGLRTQEQPLLQNT